MRFEDGGESSNVEDRRGGRIGGRSIGIGTVVLAIAAWYFGIDPSFLLNGTEVSSVSQQDARPVNASPHEEALKHFVSQVLADTEKTWGILFRNAGKQYVEPRLVLFRGATETACGTGQAAMGPFYCPADEKVYIDLGFYDDLQQRFKAPGDAAQAYVIAHEVGHHVQKLLGVSEKVQQARSRLPEAQANALSVKLELQADCLAGIWVHYANQERQVLEAGDIEEVLGAATAIGDDTLQKKARGYVTPDSFTHGSSVQRMQWFRRGFDSGSLKQCDTFQRS
ncbi:neutral zinc metallopeptidase [Uliginosibacterium sp. 31-16]|uniref:KPN_02809 family neutral zinc metallopeptidase n=1 Tax=Uliginosibacterium sp. 31-16 TaxID=3068315 RepID=UPI00273D2594|nr:neutral zinc metallopeptidase [Uliginosibacterium sp. 31-16]MDP5239168.1 neutral zinc metallopeptidase [Uliginosibacterium sp. 31-16]